MEEGERTFYQNKQISIFRPAITLPYWIDLFHKIVKKNKGKRFVITDGRPSMTLRHLVKSNINTSISFYIYAKY